MTKFQSIQTVTAPCCVCRFSLLHRAVQFHLPDDRMLVAGQMQAAAAAGGEAAVGGGKGGKRGKFRLPVGRLRPPTLADMVNSVVKFRKKRDWGRAVRRGVARAVKALAWVGLGGLAVHWWHNRRQQRLEGDTDSGGGGDKQQRGESELRRRLGLGPRHRRHTAVAA
jgi:hypothetical protein